MNREIIAKDVNGVKRCYGIGQNHQEALQNCRDACRKYMADRKDITELFLYYGESERPLIDAARYETMTVRL